MPEVVADARPMVECVNLSKSFEKTDGTEMEVFSNLECSINRGEFVSLLGPSGCGKSTLLRMMSGLTPATDGLISVEGKRVTGPPESLGMIFQEDTLLQWKTVLENVLLPAKIKKRPYPQAKARAIELLQRVGLGSFTDARPSQLSGGMKQRACICQALLCNPQLLLMDEPFGALDALTREQMQSDLQEIWMVEKSTVVMVTHSISEAVLLSDRILVFSNRPARIIADLTVPIPRPRGEETMASPEAQDLTKKIHALFRSEGVLR